MAEDFKEYTRSAGVQISGTATDISSPYEKLSKSLAGIATNVKLVAEKENIYKKKQELAIQKDIHLTQGRDNLNKILIDTLSVKNFNENALKNYQSKAAGSISGSIDSAPPEIRPELFKNLRYHAASQELQVASQVNTLQKNILESEIQKSINQHNLDMQNQAYMAGELHGMGDDENAKIHMNNAQINNAKIKSIVNKGIGLNIISGSAGENKLNTSNKNAIASYYIGMAHNALVNGKYEDFIKQFKERKHYNETTGEGLTPVEENKLIVTFNGMRQQYQQSNGINISAMNSEMNDIVVRARNGDTSDVTRMQNMLSTNFPGNPEYLTNFNQRIESATFENSLNNSIKFEPPSNAIKIVEENKPDIRQPGIARIMPVYEHASQMIRQNYSAFSNDPAGYVSESPPVRQAKEDYIKFGTGNPAEVSIAMQKYMGASENARPSQPQLSLVPSSEASLIASNANMLSLPDQMKLINRTILDNDPTSRLDSNGNIIYGSRSYMVVNDLNRAGMNSAASIVMSMAQNPQSKAFTNDVVQAFSVKKTELMKALPAKITENTINEMVRNVLMKHYLPTINVYNGGDKDTQIESVINNASILAAHYSVSGMGQSKAVNLATKVMYLNHYDFKSFKGQQIRFPYDMQYSQIKKAMNYTTDDAIASDLRIPFYEAQTGAGIERQKRETIEDLKANGCFITSPNDRSLILTYKNGEPVLKTDGSQFEIKFEDLRNPHSDLNLKLSKYSAPIEYRKEITEAAIRGVSTAMLPAEYIESKLHNLPYAIQKASTAVLPAEYIGERLETLRELTSKKESK